MDAAAAPVELHHAIDQGEEGEVAPLADPLAGVKLGAHLADQDAAGADRLAAEAFYAAALGLESRPLRLEPCPFLWAMGVACFAARTSREAYLFVSWRLHCRCRGCDVGGVRREPFISTDKSTRSQPYPGTP